MHFFKLLFFIGFIILLYIGCSRTTPLYYDDPSSDGDADGDSDGDADGDSDGDADGDSDGDGDGDSDGDGDGDSDGDGDADHESDTDFEGCILGETMLCTCEDGREGAKECEANGLFGPCICAAPDLEWFQTNIIGEWEGSCDTPWVDYSVNFRFDEDGHYSAYNLDQGGVPALYWGTDEDFDSKQYEIDDFNEFSEAFGTLNIVWGPGNYQEAIMEFITITNEAQHLEFTIWRDNYGPLIYSLDRTPEIIRQEKK